MARKTSVDDMRRELAKRAALRNQLVLRVFAGELTADQESLRQGAGRIFHHALCQRGQQDSPKEGTMLSKRTLLGALLAGLGVSLAGCYEPTAYSGALRLPMICWPTWLRSDGSSPTAAPMPSGCRRHRRRPPRSRSASRKPHRRGRLSIGAAAASPLIAPA